MTGDRSMSLRLLPEDALKAMLADDLGSASRIVGLDLPTFFLQQVAVGAPAEADTPLGGVMVPGWSTPPFSNPIKSITATSGSCAPVHADAFTLLPELP